MQLSITGIAWYRAEDYDRLKRMFKDGWKLPDTFPDWQESAQNIYEKLNAEGLKVVNAPIDPNTFPEWCRARGMEMDAKARLAYSSECAANAFRAQQSQ